MSKKEPKESKEPQAKKVQCTGAAIMAKLGAPAKAPSKAPQGFVPAAAAASAAAAPPAPPPPLATAASVAAEVGPTTPGSDPAAEARLKTNKDRIDSMLTAAMGDGPGKGLQVSTAAGSRGTLAARVAALETLCLQLEARVRALEAVMFVTLKVVASHGAVLAAVEALRLYRLAVAEDPEDHGLGPPHVAVALAFIRTIALTPLSATAEPGLRSRRALIMMLYDVMATQNVTQICTWIPHFAVAVLPPNRKQAEPQALVIFKMEGSTGVPRLADLDKVEGEIAESMAAQAGLATIAAQFYEWVDDTPYGGRSHLPVSNVFTSFLCGTGAVRTAGKAPVGGAARNVKKGKGKGKKLYTAQQMDEDEDL